MCFLIWASIPAVIIPSLFSVQHCSTRWRFQIVLIFIPNMGKIPILTNIFERGWNHQLVQASWTKFCQTGLHATSSSHWWTCSRGYRGGLSKKGALEVGSRSGEFDQILGGLFSTKKWGFKRSFWAMKKKDPWLEKRMKSHPVMLGILINHYGNPGIPIKQPV